MNTTKYRDTRDRAAPLIPANEAFASVGIGRSLGYSMISSGTVAAVKLGRRTMLRAEDWQKFLETLPSYRPSKKSAA